MRVRSKGEAATQHTYTPPIPRPQTTHPKDGEHEDADGRRVAEALQVHLLHHGDDQLRGVEEEALWV